MRDAHRIKEKDGFSIEGRPLGGLILGGLLAMGLTFYSGMGVGKRMAMAPQALPAENPLASLDKKAAALAQVRHDPLLTFQDELTRKLPEPPSSSPDQDAALLRRASTVPFTDKVESGAIPTRTGAMPPPNGSSEPAGNGAFTLQLGASPSREDAERQAERLRGRGYAPYIAKAQVPGKGIFYRVRMGSFATKDAAQRFLEDVRRETQLEAYVASTK